ncbi:hypothetical protein ABIF69_005914 [Bradyrhizobium japonicum]|uniref:Uncharacterized protein n=1 Tax=Bradyrhizobium barranii subsp. barranii TaxID=2823807 RepID=A0A939LZ87_9BRAD|nr:hypothetical protein [Bradyrhizobium barranii]UEM13214.1 hypothetical protein J4G43_002335 [Bradyrhizobium barranii subsp. barranii]
MRWYLLQSTIVFAVVASNIRWHWTPNPYLPSIAGVGLALVATLIFNDIATLRARKKRGSS